MCLCKIFTKASVSDTFSPFLVRMELYSELLDGLKTQKLDLAGVAKYIVPMIQDANPQVCQSRFSRRFLNFQKKKKKGSRPSI